MSESWVEFTLAWFPIFLFAALVYYIFRSDHVIKKRMSNIDQSVKDQKEILETLREIRELLKKDRA